MHITPSRFSIRLGDAECNRHSWVLQSRSAVEPVIDCDLARNLAVARIGQLLPEPGSHRTPNSVTCQPKVANRNVRRPATNNHDIPVRDVCVEATIVVDPALIVDLNLWQALCSELLVNLLRTHEHTAGTQTDTTNVVRVGVAHEQVRCLTVHVGSGTVIEPSRSAPTQQLDLAEVAQREGAWEVGPWNGRRHVLVVELRLMDNLASTVQSSVSAEDQGLPDIILDAIRATLEQALLNPCGILADVKRLVTGIGLGPLGHDLFADGVVLAIVAWLNVAEGAIRVVPLGHVLSRLA